MVMLLVLRVYRLQQMQSTLLKVVLDIPSELCRSVFVVEVISAQR